MTEKEAQKRARAYANKNPTQTAFVYRERNECGHWEWHWCTEFDYYHGSCQDVPEQNVIWSTSEGYY